MVFTKTLGIGLKMSDSVALIVVAPNARLGREITAKGWAQPIQLRSLAGLRKKLEEHPTAFLLLEWNFADGETPLRTINACRRDFSTFRFAVFCPDLPERTAADAETMRFLLFECGAVAVFANRRELAALANIIKKKIDARSE